MALAPGFRLGVYEIRSALGAGGMGEVYRAHDTRLHRDVALKVLPDTFATDQERLARFAREAHILASINHANIGAIFEIETEGPIHALVLEFVDGPTLADRIATGPLPINEALRIARQIADALGASHEHGIIHRDLKPANIKVRPDGTVKVLDFGLAKTIEPTTPDVSHSPTITSPAFTRAGAILGTAAYMAPEQAIGGNVDARSDIWSFGIVLYEMLTGRRAFPGETVAEILSNVLKEDIDWSALPVATPPVIHALLRRCAQKDPAHRLRSAIDARFQIEEALQGAAIAVDAPSGRRSADATRLRWLASAAVAVALAGWATAWYVSRSPGTRPEMRLEVTTPPTIDPISLAISPDGRQVAFVASADGQSKLWVRSLDTASAKPLPETEGAMLPFWSPDSRSLAFSANRTLKRVDVSGGAARTLSEGGGIAGGAWNRDGTILFSGAPDQPLFAISAEGGQRSAVTRVDEKQTGHRHPQFLPDNRHFLYYAIGSARGIYLGELGATGAPRLIVEAQAGVYSGSGHLLFVQEGILLAQPFDVTRFELTGRPVAVADHIVLGTETGAALSASADGTIVYRTGNASGPRELLWIDRSGHVIDRVAGSAAVGRTSIALSPDGGTVAYERAEGEGGSSVDIWTLDLNRGVSNRMTFDSGFDLYPIWSRDGREILFSSNRNSKWELFARRVDGSEERSVAAAVENAVSQGDWSPGGRYLFHGSTSGQGSWILPVNGGAKPVGVGRGSRGKFASDGNWVAFESRESGQMEIYVQRFPAEGSRTRISTAGGSQVLWREDGRELFYVTPANELMSVPIQLDAKLGTVIAGTPKKLFTMQLPTNNGGWQYAVTKDGQRFLVDALPEVTIPITVVIDWKPAP